MDMDWVYDPSTLPPPVPKHRELNFRRLLREGVITEVEQRLNVIPD